jgi:hypothetical protein
MRMDQTNPSVHRALLQRWQRSVDPFITALSTGPAEGRMARLLITLGCTGDHPETLPTREVMVRCSASPPKRPAASWPSSSGAGWSTRTRVTRSSAITPGWRNWPMVKSAVV